MDFVIHWNETAMGLHVFPILIPPSHLPLHPIPLDLPSAPGPSTCLMHPTWAGDLSFPTTLIWFNQGTRLRWWKPDSVIVLYLVTRSCPTLCEPKDCSPPGTSVREDSPGKNTGVGCHALLQGIFPSWELNSGLPLLQADSLPFEPNVVSLNQSWSPALFHRLIDLSISFQLVVALGSGLAKEGVVGKITTSERCLPPNPQKLRIWYLIKGT